MPTEIAFPISNRIWLRSGYGYDLSEQYSRLRTRLGSQLLRVATDGAARFSASLMLTGAQRGEFLNWHQYVLLGGGLWFLAPVESNGTVATREVRFLAPPRVELIGVNNYRVTADFETRGGNHDTYEAYAGFGVDDPNINFG